jgi:3-hydroxyisobutyrate dehydrogenase-like beta-hydroxyacid dehydrogenase
VSSDTAHTVSAVGIIGLGLVGSAIAQRLRGAGYTCVGFDIAVQACERFAAAGGKVATSARDVGQKAPVLITAVFDTNDVLKVIEGPNGALEGGTPRVVIDCSTGDPELLTWFADRLRTRGIGFIEAPLSGSSAQIAAGEATMLLGGDAAAIAAHAALLDAIAPRRLHAGGTGMGARAKLATNLVLGLNRAAFAEGLVFAEKLGIAPEKFLELVLASPARSDAAAVKGPLMASGDFAPQSRIRQHLKDVDLMLEHARRAHQRLPLSEAHAELMRAAIEAGDGDLDNAAIVRQIRRETS